MSVPGEDVWAEYARACAWIDIDGRLLMFDPSDRGGNELWPFDLDVVHVITAFNPRSRTTDAITNEQCQLNLEDELLDRPELSAFPADGADKARTRVERSIAVLGLTREEAAGIGLRYDQNAVFEIDRNEIRIVGCDEPVVRSTSGYLLTVHPGRS